MRVLIAVDSFKGSLTSAEAGGAIAEGLESGFAELGIQAAIDIVPIADGGEGTIEAFAAACGGERVPVLCPGPLCDPVSAEFLILPGGKTAVIEMAQSCGLTLVRGREDILRSDTAGLGRQILAALDRRPERLLIGIGGSATNDWGAGMAGILGARFLNDRGLVIGTRPIDLADLHSMDLSGLDSRIKSIAIESICDVDNPLLGPKGAAAVYGPQKGAGADTVKRLDEIGSRFADAVESSVGQETKLCGRNSPRQARYFTVLHDVSSSFMKPLNQDNASQSSMRLPNQDEAFKSGPGLDRRQRLRDFPGSGAAGGLGFGLAAFLGAELRSGIEVMIDAARLRERILGVDLIVTGEGRLDAQSQHGKTTAGIAALARNANIPCLAFCGSVEGPTSSFIPEMFAAVYTLSSVASSLDDSMANGAEYLRMIARCAACHF